MAYCDWHRYHYKQFCWFCFCEFLEIQPNSVHYSGYDQKLLDAFLKKFPKGKLTIKARQELIKKRGAKLEEHAKTV